MKRASFVLIAFFFAIAEASAAQRLLIVSDIHFNPLADPALADQLIVSEPKQWESIFAGDSHLPLQKYNDDSTWPLLAALVTGLQNVQPRPKVIVLTGDIIPHKFLEKFTAATHSSDAAAFRSFTKKTVAFVSLELEKASGGIPVIYSIGNNDQDCGDYALQPNGPFLTDSSDSVAMLAKLDAKAMAEWSSLGSYATVNPLAPHHRFLAVNSNFWSRRYVNSCGDKSADPGDGELKWLADQLKDAEKHGDKVWLIYHIPPGIDGHSSSRANQVTPMWKPQYASRFNQLLDEYRKTIELNLAGHTHLDDIRLVKTEHTDTLVLINPAVSPNVGQNPAFRVMTVDSKARPLDLMTYYMPDVATMKWQLEYSTRAAYGLKKIDVKSYESLYKQIDDAPDVADKWKLYYSVSRLAGLSDSKAYLRSLYCASGHADEAGYESCLTVKTAQ